MMRTSSTMDRLGFASWRRRLLMAAAAAVLTAGCETPSAHTTSRNYGLRDDVPVDPPEGAPEAAEAIAKGGHLFKLYCGSCHNARPLGERPFSNYAIAMTHMRDQAYLTGKEYRQLIAFLRRWDNVGPPTPPTDPSPKRFVYSQPIAEQANEAEGAPLPPAPAGGGAFRRPADVILAEPEGAVVPQPGGAGGVGPGNGRPRPID